MKEKTKKRLRAVAQPFKWVWAALAIIIGLSGVLLEALAYFMLDDTQMAKQTIKDHFKL